MTPRRGTLLGLVLGWLAVVVVVGGLTFTVVSRAGSGVGQASAMRTVAAAPVATTSSSPPASPDPDDDPQTPSSTPRPTNRPTDGPPSAPSTPDPPTTRTRSFTTVGGTVVAGCTGSRIEAESITVRDGWRFEDERESSKLEIHFSRSGSEREDASGEGDASAVAAGATAGTTVEEEGEVELVLFCADGVPTRGSE